MLCPHRSRIPHLALSICSKRATVQLRSSSPRLSPGLAHRHISSAPTPTSPFRPLYCAHRHASTKATPATLPKTLRARQQASQHRTPIPLIEREPPKDEQSAVPKGLHMSFNTYFWVVSVFGFVLSTYCTYTYMSYRRAVRESETLELAQDADVSSRWMDLSRNYDDEVELSEKLMFLRSKRERLCQAARGNVLEVSAGTGRNMDLYRLRHDPEGRTPKDKRVKSAVFNDLSEVMLYQAEKKFDKMQEQAGPMGRFRGPVTFVVGDAADRRVISRPEGGFDTIVQTMGVCSMANPVGFLRRLAELCRQPGEESSGLDKEVIEQESRRRRDYGASEEEGQEDVLAAGGDLGGKILLLEHGRSYYGFLNRFLDNGAKMHADHYGCWWNKDIEQVVRDSGLIVESKRRYHFGTTYEYVLRPPPKDEKGGKK